MAASLHTRECALHDVVGVGGGRELNSQARRVNVIAVRVCMLCHVAIRVCMLCDELHTIHYVVWI
jgi:hypothetical protein